MALVVIQSIPLTREQKQRIGERLLAALHQEGVSASSTVVLFQREAKDILLDGLLVEACASEGPIGSEGLYPMGAHQDLRTRARRTRAELQRLKEDLLRIFREQFSLDSLSARHELGLLNCEWAAGTIRRLFRELEQEGLIIQQGRKRGTRYVLKRKD